MALIVCRHCRKTVSDTVETCIHCGGLIAEPINQPEVTLPQETAAQTKSKKTTIYDYSSFSDERKQKLEKAFLESDAWAYKYRHTGNELRSFKSLFCNIILCLWLSATAFLLAFIFLADMRAYDVNLILYALAGAGILFAVSAIISIILFIVLKIRKNSDERLIYLKKYQKWLMEEKNVSYKPKFAKAQMQEVFNWINLERTTY